MNKKSLSESEADAFRSGDRRIMQCLFNAYHRRLYLYCFQLLNDKQDAEDVVAESLVKLWLSRKSIKNDDHIFNFLFLTAKNKCIDVIRKKKRTNKIFVQGKEEGRQSPDENYDVYNRLESMVYSDVMDIILKEVDNFPPKRKTVAQLIFVECKSIKEIARVLRLSPKTVYIHRNMAIRKLREALGPPVDQEYR